MNALDALKQWEQDTEKPASASEGNAFIDGFQAAAAQLAEKEREIAQLRIDYQQELFHTEARAEAAEQRLQEAQADVQHWQARYVTQQNLCWSFRDELAELRERLRQREAELEQAVSALREVHDGHTRSLSSGTGKITVCTCRICSVLPSPPKEAKS